MDWFVSLLDFTAKLGITAIAFAGAVWAAITFLGQKYATLYFDKQLEAHKEALKSIYGRDLETHKAAQQKLVEEEKGRIQQKVELTKGFIQRGLDGARTDDQVRIEEIKTELDKRKKIMDSEILLQIESSKIHLDLGSKTSLALSERRLQPYRELWQLSEPLSPDATKAIDRAALRTAFRNWYYTNGNGLFLSWDAMDAYLRAIRLLRKADSEVPDDLVRDAFSALRTQMKLDLSVYSSATAMAQLAADG